METINETYVCKYCNKGFKKESTLAVHLCEPKRRYSQQNEKGVQLGLQAYLRFYEMTQGSAKYKTYDDFAKSPYYGAFVKWGRHCVNINAINVKAYIEWLLKNNKKLDYWTQKLDRDLFRMSENLSKKIEEADRNANRRIDLAFDEIGVIKEYTKLLHSLSHNLVVELTKLKIEQEAGNLKSRVLEKDFAFLEKREKALEEQVFK